jgi:hypothetical protein
MSTLACQPIVEEPPAPLPVNHPPRIIEDKISPSTVVVDVDPTQPQGCEPIYFRVGQAEDIDLDQNLRERWYVDLTQDSLGWHNSGSGDLPLSRIPNAPSLATDPQNAFRVDISTLDQSRDHTVQVFVSDGFDPDITAAQAPYTPLSDRAVVSRPWVIHFAGKGTCSP